MKAFLCSFIQLLRNPYGNVTYVLHITNNLIQLPARILNDNIVVVGPQKFWESTKSSERNLKNLEFLL